MISLLGSYLFWHYTRAFDELTTHFKNFVWFFYHFFSIPVLLKTFTAPWRRLGEAYPKGVDLTGFMTVLIINTLMRLVGMFMRLVLILSGLITTGVVVLVGLLIFIIWAILPWLCILMVVSGFRFFFM